MRAAAERLADVLGERADIGALAADHAQHEARRRGFEHFKLRDAHLARRARDFFAPPREPVERRALVLERGMHRRHLLDLALESFQYRGKPLDADRPGLVFAFGVTGSGALAELQRRHVFLVVQERAGELGRFAEEDDEQPEASGSSVPACPALAARSAFFAFCSAALDVRPTGLSSSERRQPFFFVALSMRRESGRRARPTRRTRSAAPAWCRA